MTVGRARDLARFSPERFSALPLLATDELRVLLVALEPGQEIPVHAPDVALVVTVAEGVGELLVDGELQPLHAGDVAVVPAGASRGIRARSARLVLVSVVAPPPTDADHAPVGAWPADDATAADPAAAIRAEHAAIRPRLDHIRALADELEHADEATRRERLAQAVAFLREDVLAHAELEEETVYPAAERLLRALGGATATMTLEHELIRARVDALEQLAGRRQDEAARAELGRAIVALLALLEAHFEAEERVYVPLLAHLRPAEAAQLAAALDAGGHVH